MAGWMDIWGQKCVNINIMRVSCWGLAGEVGKEGSSLIQRSGKPL